MGEVTYIDDDDLSDMHLDLKLNPDSKFVSDEEIILCIGKSSKNEYKIGDKLFVYCYDLIEDTMPLCLHAKWIYRYGRAE